MSDTSSPTLPARGRGLDGFFFAYNAALLLALPLLAATLASHQLSGRRWRHGWGDRLGRLPVSPAGRPVLWAHAVSAGEALALGSILRAVRRLAPDAWIVVTTITDTGQAVARHQCKGVADHIGYLPFDLLPCMAPAVARVRPDVVMLTESELWPNLVYLTARRGGRVVLVNGRISQRNYDRLRRRPFMGSLFGRLLRRVDRLCMQTELYRDRAQSLGGPAERMEICGNAKLDTLLAQDLGQKVAALRRELGVGEGEPLVVAGSTHTTEEQVVLEAFRLVQAEVPECRLILAPRHLNRADEVLALARATGFECGRRTELREGGKRPAVVVLDTMGELVACYALGAAAFVGGSFITLGGHNVLEPVACGKPALYGPHMHGQQELEEAAREGGVGFTVHDSGELAARWLEFLQSADRQAEMAARGRAVLERHQGSSQRYAEVIAEELGR